MSMRASGTALLVLGPLAFVAFGLLVDGAERFDRLRLSVQYTPAGLPSSKAVPAELVELGVPVLSLYVDSSQLHDPDTGLMSDPGRGSTSETPATVSYFDNGRLVFGSGVGLRVHGSRHGERLDDQSYRLHFRRQYGSSQMMPGMLFDGQSDPLTTVVARRTQRRDDGERTWYLVNPLAYDIATRLGAVTPYTHPAQLVVNGSRLGLYVLTEHIRAPFLRRRFGHSQFIRADAEMEDALARTVDGLSTITMASVNGIIDVDSLTRWFLSVIYCSTRDPFQAVLLRDQTRPAARWIWVNWDMDQSFMGSRDTPNPWTDDTMAETLGQEHVESRILTRLIAEDPDYRRYLAEALTEALNHRVTVDFLRERFEHYSTIAQRHDVEHRDYLAILERFLMSRHSEVRRHVARHLEVGRAFYVDVRTPNGIEIEVDGYRQLQPYAGWYFDGGEIEIDIGAQPRNFSHWLVNEQRVDTRTLRHRVTADTVIVPVMHDP